MNDDVKKVIYGTVIVFAGLLVWWFGIIFANSCGGSLNCSRGTLTVERTPIPTLLPANLPAIENTTGGVSTQCRVSAADFVGAWVNAGSPETDAFQFADINGQNCEATFEEVRPLFIESNLWYSGSMSCVACHSANVATSSAQLDLGTYAGIKSGSRRADAESAGTDILAAGKWGSSLLYEFISTSKADVPGHTDIQANLLIFAGKPLPTATPTP
ncbi:MAG: hypothetical protein HZB18_01495 [Chloroflexi bacterium]|nr:hypothetical protein [Chloroflexota bacterium]